MRFRKRETDLERELRAQRPEPRDEFVRSLSKLVEPTRSMRRRTGLPKLALVGAMTVLLAASLGVTGALGSAGSSLHSFSRSIGHLIAPNSHPGHPISALNGPTTSSSSATNTPAAGTPPGDPGYPPGYSPTPGPVDANGRVLGASGFPLPNPNRYPIFFPQYGFRIPICFGGHIIEVTPFQLIWYLFHGAQPYWRCLK